jgi:hypothetical protein
MTFKAQLVTDLDVFYNTDEFAETVTYRPSGYTAVSIPAIIDYGKGFESEGSDSLNTNATIRIRVSDIATVAPGDEVTIGAGSWRVMDAKIISDGLEWEAVISRMNR